MAVAASVQAMYQCWKDFDLVDLQKTLDSTATEIATRQDESDNSRKQLVEKSRDFKKGTQEDVRKAVAPLLKSFQGEVDSLSKRSKAAEAAFLSVYKRLIDIPDPAPVLETAVTLQKRSQRATDLEIENQKLRETLDEYNSEFAHVKNQEVTIKGLKDKLKEHEDKMENAAQLRAKEKERELQRQFGEKERELQETQLTVAKKLGEAELRASTLQSALDNVQSELFDMKSKYDEATGAKSDELEMVMADLDRANERATAAEREAEKLKSNLDSATQNLQQASQMQTAPNMEQALDILKRSSMEVELQAKEREVGQLVEDVQKLQASLTKLRDSSSTQIAALEEEIAAKSRVFKLLEEKMRSQEDYEEIKRELNILKSIEFDGSSKGSSANADEAPKSLELLLLEKNKQMQTEVTQLKVANNELKGSEVEATRTVASEPPRTPPPRSVQSGDARSTPSANGSRCDVISPGTPRGPPQPPGPLGSTDVFAAMLGHEMIAYNLAHAHAVHAAAQVQLVNGTSALPSPAIPNGLVTSAAMDQALVARIAHEQALRAHAAYAHQQQQHQTTQPLSPSAAPPQPPVASLAAKSSSSNAASPSDSATPLDNSSATMARLQTIARTESASAQTLDTAAVAARIRELLSTHNIGQRLFAKHVLGLSQGTVSELLSKPKHWDKLTEKGRESYRKMHAWALDGANVDQLKALSPKRANAPIVGAVKQEDSLTEERIVRILSKARESMVTREGSEQKNMASAMVNSIYQQELAKMAAVSESRDSSSVNGPRHGTPGPTADGGTPRQPADSSPAVASTPSGIPVEPTSTSRGRRPQSDSQNLTQDFVTRIYQDELTKLAESARRSGNFAEQSMYQQELTRLAQTTAAGGIPSLLAPEEEPCDLSMKSIKREPEVPIQDEPQDLRKSRDSDSHVTSSLRHAGSAFFLVRPRDGAGSGGGVQSTTGHDVAAGSSNSKGEPSPLQRMQNIANSLMSKNQGQLGQSNRPLRAILPPITQEDFDHYTNLNTDSLVKKVKDALGQYSISQRLFGESVLGLSQGSVSDLLARPKPWNMLTQKGREPFIRMQLFLEDPGALQRLLSSQYRIPADKLLRGNGAYADDDPVPTPAATDTPPAMTSFDSASTTSSVSPTNASVIRESSTAVTSSVSNPAAMLNGHASSPLNVTSSRLTHQSPLSPSRAPAFPPPPPPFCFTDAAAATTASSGAAELGAVGGEIDTIAVTSHVKEVLQFHNLGQRLFGEAILGLSQGSVSELLSKPKPWAMLSLKGREPFIKMQLWLTDPHGVDRLRLFQSEQKAYKRRRASSDDRGGDCGNGKKPRVFFSEDQKEMLRNAYRLDPYPNQSTIESLAQQLSVGTKTIVNWFHNHRMRAKQQHSATNVGSPGRPIKSEPSEDLSNHSDPTLADGCCQQGESATGCDPAVASQWLFPQFEPVSLDMRTPRGRRTSTNSSASSGPMVNGIAEQQLQHSSPPRSSSAAVQGLASPVRVKTEDVAKQPLISPPEEMKPKPVATQSSSKRKSAKPQRVLLSHNYHVKDEAELVKMDVDDDVKEKKNDLVTKIEQNLEKDKNDNHEPDWQF